MGPGIVHSFDLAAHFRYPVVMNRARPEKMTWIGPARAGLVLAILVGLMAQAAHFHGHDHSSHHAHGECGDHGHTPSSASDFEECLGCHLARLPRSEVTDAAPTAPTILFTGFVRRAAAATRPESLAPTTLRNRGPPFSA